LKGCSTNHKEGIPLSEQEKPLFCDCDVIHEDVVNRVREKMYEKEQYIDLAALFKIFADGTRVQLLHALEQGEMCVCDLAVLIGATKSAVSHQLKTLRMSNLVKFRKEAQTVFYSLADSHVEDILNKGFEHIWE
jgi:DNA-binding transcriptional ArsR family regulator